MTGRLLLEGCPFLRGLLILYTPYALEIEALDVICKVAKTINIRDSLVVIHSFLLPSYLCDFLMSPYLGISR